MAEKPVLSRSSVTECEGVSELEGGADHRPSNGKTRWYKQTFDPAVAKHPERDAAFITGSSTPVDPLYTREDLADRNLSYDTDIGYPGEFPYTRGIHPSGYRGKLWTMRQFAGFGTAEDSNERYLRLLEMGQTGLSVAFHHPTLVGRDSDELIARGEVGKQGVAIDSLADMETLFDQIPLEQVTTSMTINHPACVLLCMYVAAGQKKGIAPRDLAGTIQNDVLKEFIAQKTFVFPPLPAMRIMGDVIEWCTAEMPRWNWVSVSGYHIREAGSTAAQELAFTLRDGMEYVQAGLDRGLDIDSFAPRLSFFFIAHNDLFEEVAKYMAARKLWARYMRDRYGAKSPRSWWIRFHTQTAGSTLLDRQPRNNVMRVTLQALAAVMGGTQSLHTNALDETIALPTEENALIALRTQQVIAHESGVANTVDPLGGSYYIESLTADIEEEAEEIFTKIDELGGMVSAIDNGYPQREIQEAAYQYQREIEKNQRIIVGQNDFTGELGEPIDYLYIDDTVEEKQVERLAALRRRRDAGAVERALEAVRYAAGSDANLMPAILEAVHAYATVGEICGAMRDVFGEYQEQPIF
ncbi:MAG: methylmalonyl-CoA mutase family protein [Acidobacteriota bacterium]|nr:methylmalonyl-CoA mutase family protein [Acidobacteriota bacterium]